LEEKFWHFFGILSFLVAAKGTHFKMISSASKRNKMQLEKFHRVYIFLGNEKEHSKEDWYQPSSADEWL
jgi:hypothetical protein